MTDSQRYDLLKKFLYVFFRVFCIATIGFLGYHGQIFLAVLVFLAYSNAPTYEKGTKTITRTLRKPKS